MFFITSLVFTTKVFDKFSGFTFNREATVFRIFGFAITQGLSKNEKLR